MELEDNKSKDRENEDPTGVKELHKKVREFYPYYDDSFKIESENTVKRYPNVSLKGDVNREMKSSANFDSSKAEIGKDGVVDATEPLSEFVLTKTPEPSIKWSPDDYGFETPNGMTGVWYSKNLELRSLKYNYWLLRKKIKNSSGNIEMLVKWYVQILPSEKDFADSMFSKGLR